MTTAADAARWQRVKDVLATALELPEEGRRPYLDSACAQDPGLRAEVDSLLAAAQDATGFIEAPALAAHGHVLDQAIPDTGTAIGPYVIERELGRGGMGVVYLARRNDGAFTGAVAIKLLPPWLASADLKRRFHNERQVLATLAHPHIARLLDGGTTTGGVPYLVMEYVDGTPIDRYCDLHTLGLDARLTLFRTVCAAVQYAHQHLVVHRDLKPGNVLVTAEGSVKLLDFGIAKLIDPEQGAGNDATRDMQLFTPGYASPEQIRNGTITTASDVHALGVLLYVLLTGAHPFEAPGCSQHEVIAAVCEREPRRPSALRGRRRREAGAPADAAAAIAAQRATTPARLHRQLRGDLDNIVAKALAKDPARRYATVDELASDVARHQRSLPVRARPQGLAYRARKFVRRNPWNVAAGATAIIALTGALVMAQWQAVVATAQRERAELHASNVRKLANALLFELNDELGKGPTRARKLMVDKALEYLNVVAKESGHDAAFTRELAGGYEKIGAIQGLPLVANLGDAKSAIENYNRAMAMRESLLVADPANATLKRELAKTYEDMSTLLAFSGEAGRAHAFALRALALAQELARVQPDDVATQMYLARQYANVAERIYDPGHPGTGNSNDALAYHARALDLRERMVRAHPARPDLRLSLDGSYQTMADLYLIKGKPAESVAMGQRCQELLEGAVRAAPENPAPKRRLALCYRKIAHALAEQGMFVPALDFARKSLELRENVARADPDNIRFQRDVALGYSGVGAILQQSGDHRGAAAAYRQWVAMTLRLGRDNPSDQVLRINLRESQGSLGDALRLQGRHAQAIAAYREAMQANAELGDAGIRGGAGTGSANILVGLGSSLVAQHAFAEGLAYLDKAVADHEAFVASDPFNAWARRDLARAYAARAAALRGQAMRDGDTAERATRLQRGCAEARRAAATWEGMRADGILSPKDAAEAARDARRAACGAATPAVRTASLGGLPGERAVGR